MNPIKAKLNSAMPPTRPTMIGDDLPTPQQFPDADLVIFDGQCAFCSSQVRTLKRLDGRNRLAFVSLHDEFVAAQFPDLSHEQLMTQMYIVPNSASGYTYHRYGGAAAVRYLTRRLPKLWILAPLFHIPFTQRIQQWSYQQIAKRRYQVAGKTGSVCNEQGTCDLHFHDSAQNPK